MLCDIHKKLDINGEIEPEFIESVIFGGHDWGLKWKYSGLFQATEDNYQNVEEVTDILDMWAFIENAYKTFSKADKVLIKEQADPFGEHVELLGFDGNNETEHLGIAEFLINDVERFTQFKGRDLNSHMPSLDAYKRMLQVFKPMQASSYTGLGVPLVMELLKVRLYPN